MRHKTLVGLNANCLKFTHAHTFLRGQVEGEGTRFFAIKSDLTLKPNLLLLQWQTMAFMIMLDPGKSANK